MGTLNAVFEAAHQRASDHHLPYAGALTPLEAGWILENVPSAKLVDVRTRPELDLVGRVPGAEHIEWAYYPDMRLNPDFLRQLTQQVDKEAVVMFLCRSGARSHSAATLAAEAGYASCYNVLEGFEGVTDPASGQRGKVNGWKVAGLPWTN
ncbi:MAG: rhodanese-like domain-containing protein [Methylobacillus sp.]|jgi:rhodanese-related sulfurtransferase|nr:rhodanese-like domain-containing protein [Methylobacillus sp.]